MHAMSPVMSHSCILQDWSRAANSPPHPVARCKQQLKLHSAHNATQYRLSAVMQGVETLSLQEQYSVTLSTIKQHIRDGLGQSHLGQLRSKTLQVCARMWVALEATSVSHPVQP